MKHLILVGGTGQHVGLALLRLFDLCQFKLNREEVKIWLVDADKTGQVFTRLETRQNWLGLHEILQIQPFPSNLAENTLRSLLSPEGSTEIQKELFDLIFDKELQDVNISAGMHGSPQIGASVLHSALLDLEKSVNLKELRKDVIQDFNGSKVILIGSSFGGTGSGGMPALARYITRETVTIPNTKVFLFLLDNLFRLQVQRKENITKTTTEFTAERLIENSVSLAAFYGGAGLQEYIYKGYLLGIPEDPDARANTGFKNQPEHVNFIYLVTAMLVAEAMFSETGPGDPGLNVLNIIEPYDEKFYYLTSPNNERYYLIPALRYASVVSKFLYRLADLIYEPPNPKMEPLVTSTAFPSELYKALLEIQAISKSKDFNVVCQDVAKLLLGIVDKIDVMIDWICKTTEPTFFPINHDVIQPKNEKIKVEIDNPMPFFRKAFNKKRFKFNRESPEPTEALVQEIISSFHTLIAEVEYGLDPRKGE